MLDFDAQYEALQRRDPALDGVVFVAVARPVDSIAQPVIAAALIDRRACRPQRRSALHPAGVIEEARFAPDSLLEESGFEPLVPLATEMLIELARGI